VRTVLDPVHACVDRGRRDDAKLADAGADVEDARARLDREELRGAYGDLHRSPVDARGTADVQRIHVVEQAIVDERAASQRLADSTDVFEEGSLHRGGGMRSREIGKHGSRDGCSEASTGIHGKGEQLVAERPVDRRALGAMSSFRSTLA